MTMRLTSETFHDGGRLDPKHTCDGAGISPGFRWVGAPEGVKSFALIVHDPDAPSGDLTHWLLFDIPGDANSLEEGEPVSGPDGITGKNEHGENGYLPACPPVGDGMHRYMFEFYALRSAKLDLDENATRVEVERAVMANMLDQAHIQATYQRR